jgi:hypothetical protein
MEKGYGLLLFVFLLGISPFISAQEVVSSQVAYCEHMGYVIEINNLTNTPFCIFEDGLKCDATEFYNGLCGKDKFIDFPPRKAGEKVYLDFEKCEDGLIIKEPNYLLDLPECSKPSIFNKFFDWVFK